MHLLAFVYVSACRYEVGISQECRDVVDSRREKLLPHLAAALLSAAGVTPSPRTSTRRLHGARTSISAYLVDVVWGRETLMRARPEFSLTYAAKPGMMVSIYAKHMYKSASKRLSQRVQRLGIGHNASMSYTCVAASPCPRSSLLHRGPRRCACACGRWHGDPLTAAEFARPNRLRPHRLRHPCPDAGMISMLSYCDWRRLFSMWLLLAAHMVNDDLLKLMRQAPPCPLPERRSNQFACSELGRFSRDKGTAKWGLADLADHGEQAAAACLHRLLQSGGSKEPFYKFRRSAAKVQTSAGPPQECLSRMPLFSTVILILWRLNAYIA
jgi:hypothetical protein